MVVNRALNPSSKLVIEDWIKDKVFISRLNTVDSKQLYRSMDFLLECKEELELKAFDYAAHLMILEDDLLYFDTTSIILKLIFRKCSR